MFHIFSLLSWQPALTFSEVLQTYETDLLIFLTDSVSERLTVQPVVAGFAGPLGGQSAMRVVCDAAARLSHWCEHSLVSHELCREGRKELGFLILRDIALINKEEQI